MDLSNGLSINSSPPGAAGTAFEGDREGVEGGLPAHRLAGLGASGGIEGAVDEAEAFQRGLVGEEVSPDPHGPAVAAVKAFDGVRAVDDLSDLDVVVQEGDVLLPGRAPELDDGRIASAPLVGKLLERTAAISALTAVCAGRKSRASSSQSARLA